MSVDRETEILYEPDVKIKDKSIDDEDVRALYSKCELVFQNLCTFWKPVISEGKTCMNYMRGNIFDQTARDIYENVQKKIVIEPRILKPRINSLVGQIMQGKRSGRIITEGDRKSVV